MNDSQTAACIAYRSTGTRCEGRAVVGAIVGYSDVCNVWEPYRVDSTANANGQYELRSVAEGKRWVSDLRQYGWTFGEKRKAERPEFTVEYWRPSATEPWRAAVMEKLADGSREQVACCAGHLLTEAATDARRMARTLLADEGRDECARMVTAVFITPLVARPNVPADFVRPMGVLT